MGGGRNLVVAVDGRAGRPSVAFEGGHGCWRSAASRRSGARTERCRFDGRRFVRLIAVEGGVVGGREARTERIVLGDEAHRGFADCNRRGRGLRTKWVVWRGAGLPSFESRQANDRCQDNSGQPIVRGDSHGSIYPT